MTCLKLFIPFLFSIIRDSFLIEKDMEDIHSQIEKEMSSILGPTGKKIHTGRSRNDQVLVDIRLFTREEIDRLSVLISGCFSQAPGV